MISLNISADGPKELYWYLRTIRDNFEIVSEECEGNRCYMRISPVIYVGICGSCRHCFISDSEDIEDVVVACGRMVEVDGTLAECIASDRCDHYERQSEGSE